MTTKQKLQLEQSEKRQRINELLAKDTLEDTDRNELQELTTRMQNIEVEYRAALVAEGEEEQKQHGQHRDFHDSESAEIRSLFTRVTLNDYLAPASAGIGLSGVAAELNSALDVPISGASGGTAVPWTMLETRAFTDTSSNDGGEAQRPILQRLFGPGVMDYLGVRMDSVPVGKTEWPLFATGVTPAQTKESTAAADPVTATFTFANLKPKKLTGAYEYTHEAAASVSALEEALRRDLADSVKSQMQNIIINGTAPTQSNPQNIQGFLAKLGAATDLSNAIATAANYGSLHALGVDGIHASKESEVMSIIGDETYMHAAGVYVSGSGESGSELLSRRSGGCMATTYLPDASNMKQSCLLHSAGPNPNGGGASMRGDSVAAVWPYLEVVRDIYSKASQGVVLTWITLWDAAVAFRSAAYKHVAIQIQ